MTEYDEQVVAEARQRSGNLLTEEFVGLIERYHPHERPGVARETIDHYADALADERDVDFDHKAFMTALDDGLTDAETWQGFDTIYTLDDDRVSVYPMRWHEALGGSTDIPEYVRYLIDEADFGRVESDEEGRGVPESDLLDVVAVVGRTNREAAKARIEELRDEGELIEDADQHPDARVRLH